MAPPLSQIANELKSAFETELKPKIDRIQDRMDEIEVQTQKAGLASPASRAGKAVEGRGPLLGLERKAAAHYTSEHAEYRPESVRVGALIANLVANQMVGESLNEDERKSFLSVLDSQGGLLIPTAIGSLFIDAVRPKTRVLQSGAQTYPMQTRDVLLPGWSTPPKAGWRGPNGNFQDGGGAFREVNLHARDVGCYVDIDNVLFEDTGNDLSGISAIIEGEVQRALAEAIDLAALTSTDVLNPLGSTTIPQGLVSVANDGTVTTNYGVPQTTLGANGASLTSWDPLIDLAAGVSQANFTPNAQIMSQRTAAALGKLKLTTNDYLRRPSYLDGVLDYQSGQVGIAYRKGTSTDASLVFMGQFDQMVIGMRGELGVLVDPYTRGTGRQTRIIVHMRADVALLNPTAFAVLDGVRA